MRIFAYGSNMNIDRLQERTPSAVKVSNALLEGYQFKCNKRSKDGSSKGNIVFTGNSEDIVWGVVFEIADTDKKSLDDAEGLNKGYKETSITVKDESSQSQEVQVYYADDNKYINENLRPFDWYKEFIVSGAQRNELPQQYVDKLKTLESVVDGNEETRNKNFKLIKKK